jgi:hypothetical protein
MHLAIFAEKFSVGVDDRSGVVVNPGPPFLENRRDDDHTKLPRYFAESRCRFSGNFLGQPEVGVIFRLTKILRPEKFRQTNNLCALPRGLPNEIDRVREIFVRFRAAPHLDERDLCYLFHGECWLRANWISVTPGFSPVLALVQERQAVSTACFRQ